MMLFYNRVSKCVFVYLFICLSFNQLSKNVFDKIMIGGLYLVLANPQRVEAAHIGRIWPAGYTRSRFTFHSGFPEYDVSCVHDGGSYRERKHIL